MTRWLGLLVVLICSFAHAQWQQNGIAVCDTTPNKTIFTFPRIASDGLGGAYICWRDVRNGDLDVYAQRVDVVGKVMWQRNGIPIATVIGNQDFPQITSDNKGNAFIAWEDGRSTNTFPFVQKINHTGQALWQPNGVKAADAAGIFISLAPDERGGVTLAWTDIENVFVQRLDSLGTRLWSNNGVQVTNRQGQIESGDVAVINDLWGGVIVAWAEGTYPNFRIYAQRIDSTGTTQWQQNGILLSDTTKGSGGVAISSDTKGGVIINWNNTDETGNVQRIRSSGQCVWGEFGTSLVASGTGGAHRNSLDYNGGAFVGKGMRIHHLDSLGKKLWGTDGSLYITTLGSNNSTQAFDGYRGVFNFTEFFKDSVGWFILGQWIDGTGAPRFGLDGKKITTGIKNGRQFYPAAVGDGKGNAIVCWNDNRNNTSAVYVTRIDTTGVITDILVDKGNIPLLPVLEQNYPNPFNPETMIEYKIPSKGLVQLNIYDSLGREISELVNTQQAPGFYRVKWDGRNKYGERMASGVYFYRLLVDHTEQSVKKIILIK